MVQFDAEYPLISSWRSVVHPRDANRRVKKIVIKDSTEASDEQTECQTPDSLSFMKFLGFETREDVSLCADDLAVCRDVDRRGGCGEAVCAL